MSRLSDECHRLYPPADPAGARRTLVLGVAGPSPWQPLATVWKAVQTDLGLPAPGIAVNGTDGLQLWFSLQQPVDGAQAQAFLDGLRRRYLAELPASRVSLDAALQVPALQAATGVWSAYIAPDLAPVFEDTPWLDSPPGDEGQASLLARLQSIPAALFDAALEQLRDTPAPPPVIAAPPPALDTGTDTGTGASAAAARRFLLGVMNDPATPLALRIDAAKALLPQTPTR